MQKFAFLKTWPCSKDIYGKGHVLRNAKFCIQRKIKNFTRNDFPNLLQLCTATYDNINNTKLSCFVHYKGVQLPKQTTLATI